jgi:hypothetical protein
MITALVALDGNKISLFSTAGKNDTIEKYSNGRY